MKIQQQLDNRHILKILGSEQHIVPAENGAYGEEARIGVIISELAEHGQLFDFIKMTGKLGEKLTRHYSRQLIVAIHYMHTAGFVHKDLKPENILIDKNFDFKVADFGMAERIEATDDSGFEKVNFGGTPAYMAPEIHLKVPFNGQVVDMFSFGIVIFAMMTGRLPFRAATQDDPYYRYFCQRRLDKFWEAHSAHYEPGFFSDSFKDLISGMLAFEPYQRLSLADVACHRWFVEPNSPSSEEVRQEMSERYATLIEKRETQSNYIRNK